ncbi:uncharacterized protein I206_106991 [Kwoniella pini CBS 10737]|uniref:Protein kinase domain-containing protein n=1 Tax=Kwoniella pini CBS 10737 TaxID=1296096 RepID=A0A1B9HZI3_9TREE|nr:uncharacterized protein I206_05466 [Kwoniella pini CBS 10737]OCF48686.1 hypothetical protein I206_05466 [Kwoniella pini CBS 10737]
MEQPKSSTSSQANSSSPLAGLQKPRFNDKLQNVDLLKIISDADFYTHRFDWNDHSFKTKAFVRIEPDSRRSESSLIPFIESLSLNPQGYPTPIASESPERTENPPFKVDVLKPRKDPKADWVNTDMDDWIQPTKRDVMRIQRSDKESETLLLRLRENIHLGVTWDVFRAEMALRDFSLSPIRVIIKFTKIGSFREDPPESLNKWDPETDPVRIDVVEHIIQEDLMLRQHLRKLQGNLVPYYYGMFVWHREGDRDIENWIIAMIMEDAGNPMSEMMCLLDLDVKKDILESLKRLREETQVIHDDMQGRHFLARERCDENSGKYAIVDYREAKDMALWDDQKRNEMKKRVDQALLFTLHVDRLEDGTIARWIDRKRKR